MNWWVRNRWGLILLLPAIALALAASSFRLFNFYLPFTYWNAQPPSGFSQQYEIDDQEYRVEVSVHLDGTERSKTLEGVASQPGVELVQVHLTLEAPASSELANCAVKLHTKDGRTYNPIGFKELGKWGGGYRCVPLSPPRPASWPITLLFAVPADAEADWLQLGWFEPKFIALPLS